MIEVDLHRFPLLASLDDEELEAVAALLEARELAADQALWREGDEAEGLVLLEHGAFRFESRRFGALGRCEAPTCLGAASLVEAGPREASAYAAAPSRALLLSRTAFARLLEEAPSAAARVLAALAGELAALMRAGLPFVA